MGIFTGDGRDQPDGGFIAFFLFVHRNPNKCDPRCVRRNLRIADPHEITKIIFSDVLLLCEYGASCGSDRDATVDDEFVHWRFFKVRGSWGDWIAPAGRSCAGAVSKTLYSSAGVGAAALIAPC